MQKKTKFTERVDPSAQEEIFFTMKVYAVKSKKEGTLSSLKYSIDFHPPFESNTNSIAPFASPLADGNQKVFNKIFDHVKELLKYIGNPSKYYAGQKKSKETAEFRREEQANLETAIKLAKGAINHITYERNSPPYVTVGALFSSTGNGDMKPPPDQAI